MTRPVDAGAWAAYQRAVVVVRIGSGLLRVEPAEPGATDGCFPSSSNETVHVITAHISHGVSAVANRQRQAELEQVLAGRGLGWWSAQGGDPDWFHVEDSVAVVGLDDEDARELGRRFDQDAIFAWTTTAWTLVSCRDDRRESTGWRCVRIADGPSAPRDER